MSRAHVIAATLGGVALATVLAGCGSTHIYDAVLRPEIAARSSRRPVELYLGAQRPSRPVYDVALVQAVGFGDDATAEDMARALRLRGYELGCDAIVRASVEVGASLAHGYGVCVRYVTGAPPRAPAPPAPPPAAASPAPPAPPPADEAPDDDAREPLPL